MKNTNNLLVLICAFWCIISCDIVNEQSTEADFTIINSTNVPIHLFFINPEFDFVVSDELLNPNDSYEGFMVESSVGGIFDDPEFFVNSFPGDSIRIIFNNERIISYHIIYDDEDSFFYSQPINRNIFRVGNYEDLGDEDFLYTITQEDFDNATPCDGPCE